MSFLIHQNTIMIMRKAWKLREYKSECMALLYLVIFYTNFDTYILILILI